MSDIVERLRRLGRELGTAVNSNLTPQERGQGAGRLAIVALDAADEIERLRLALKMIRFNWAGHSERCACVDPGGLPCDCDWPKVAAQCDAALASAPSDLLSEKDALLAALRPFAAAFDKADHPGMSDLYGEQPLSLHVRLGAWREASRLVSVNRTNTGEDHERD